MGGLTAVGVAALFASAALGQVIDDFTIADGSVTYAERNINRVGGSSAGTGDFIVGGTDHMFQNWWWFRAGAMPQERALSNQILGNAGGNHASLIYHEPVEGHGTIEFQLEYTVTELTGDIGLVQIGFNILNRSNAPTTVNFFSYADFDVSGTFGDDRATINGISNQFQRIVDSSASVFYTASSTGLTHWEIDDFSDIREKLTDVDIDDLADLTSPFGPGDYTGAFQWTIELAAEGATGDSFVGSVAKQVTIPEPSSLLLLGLGASLVRRRR